MLSYPKHHAAGREHYIKAERLPPNDQSLRSMQEIGVRVFKADEIDNWSPLKAPAYYLDAVTSVAQYAAKKFQDDKACFFPKNDVVKDLSRRLSIKTALAAPGAEAICEAFLPTVERVYFQSYLHADHIYFYRNLVSADEPESSWKWHYDNHPAEMHKLMIYLTDVYEDTAPFEYLVSPDGNPVPIPPSRTGPDNWGDPRWPGIGQPRSTGWMMCLAD